MHLGPARKILNLTNFMAGEAFWRLAYPELAGAEWLIF